MIRNTIILRNTPAMTEAEGKLTLWLDWVTVGTWWGFTSPMETRKSLFKFVGLNRIKWLLAQGVSSFGYAGRAQRSGHCFCERLRDDLLNKKRGFPHNLRWFCSPEGEAATRGRRWAYEPPIDLADLASESQALYLIFSDPDIISASSNGINEMKLNRFG